LPDALIDVPPPQDGDCNPRAVVAAAKASQIPYAILNSLTDARERLLFPAAAAFATGLQPGFDLMSGHRAIAGVVIRLFVRHPPDSLAGRSSSKSPGSGFFTPISAVMPRAALDRIHLCVRNQLQHIPGFQSHVLHSQVAGHMVATLRSAA